MLQNLKNNVDKLKMELNAEELTIGNKVKSSDGPGTKSRSNFSSVARRSRLRDLGGRKSRKSDFDRPLNIEMIRLCAM